MQSATTEGNGAFLALFDNKLNAIEYASYFGGGTYSSVAGVAVDSAGSVYVAGSAGSPEFPSKNALQPWRGGGIRGDDCFVAKLAPNRSLVYSTPLGGSGNEFCRPIAIDGSGSVYSTGDTGSLDFPVKNAYQSAYGGGGDVFLAKISDTTPLPSSPLAVVPARINFAFTTGGPAPQAQLVSVSGGTFIATAGASWLSASLTGSGLLVSVNAGSLTPGTYTSSISLLPVSGTAAAVDVGLTVFASAPMLNSVKPQFVGIGAAETTVAIAGSGFSPKSSIQVDGVLWTITPIQFVDASTLQFSVPATYFSVQYNHTIAVQNPQSALSNVLSLAVGVPSPSFTAASVVNAGSFAGGPVAPGEIITIFGTNLAGNVSFDNIPATVVYSSSTQISATVPYTATGPKTALKVGSSIPVSLDVAPSAPGIFAAVSNGDGTLTLYATGCGQLTGDALPLCQLPVSATVNAEPAQVLYAGSAPALVQGANQVNVMLPSDIVSGPISIVLTAGIASSKPFSYALP